MPTKLFGQYIATGSIPAAAISGSLTAAQLPAGTVSGSAQVDYNSITNKLSGVVSSSVQVTPLLPAGTVSSSDQVDVRNTVGIATLTTTGSNIFNASQTITGSLYISQNLVVQGSSSISYISQSTLNIGTNIVTVNTLQPTLRFGGVSVIDSGSSPQRSGSMFFDSINDQWIYIHQNQTSPTSSVLIMGPETYNNIGNETNLTNNTIPKSVNAEHIGDSQISDNGITVSITKGLSVGTNLTASQADITTFRASSINATSTISGSSIQTSGNGTIGGGLSVGTTAIGAAGEIRATSNITAYYSSDSRLKENVSRIPDALYKIKQLQGVEFDWTQEYITAHGGEDELFMRRHDVGVIAQDVEKVLPEVVATRPDGYLAVRYEKLVPLLIQAIKELSAQVDALSKDR